MTPQQRFTGPELSTLLHEVRLELGENAIIHEANRIRQGGVGGFFTKEGFEVLASAPALPAAMARRLTEQPVPNLDRRKFGRGKRKAAAAQQSGAADPILASTDSLLDADQALIDQLTSAMQSEEAWAETIGTAESASPLPSERRPVRRFQAEDLAPINDSGERIMAAGTLLERAGAPAPTQVILEQAPSAFGGGFDAPQTPAQALLQRANDVSDDERVDQLVSATRGLFNEHRTPNSHTPSSHTPSSHTPSSGAAGHASSEHVSGLLADPIDTRSDPETNVDVDTITSRAATIGAGTHQQARTRTLPATFGAMVPATNTPTHAPQATESGSNSGNADAAQRAEETACFWDDLAHLEQLLPLRPTDHATVQLIVGPLDVALPLASRFSADPTIDLAVLSDAVELVGVNGDEMAESSRDLHQRLLTRAHSGVRAIGVIEADDTGRDRGSSLDKMLPLRLLTMIDRVTEDGAVDLLRLCLRSLAPAEEMLELLRSFAVPCAIDLATAPSAAELDEALDAGLPIVSVAGRQLTPALAMALKHR